MKYREQTDLDFLKYWGIIITILAICYAFITGNINPFKWDVWYSIGGRFAIVIVLFISLIISASICKDLNEKYEEEVEDETP